MKIKWKFLLPCIAIPLAVGGLSAWLTSGSMEAYERMQKPALSPPAIVFPIVWTILFFLMGLASYLVTQGQTTSEQRAGALRIYSVQLAVNFSWTIFFFSLGAYLFSFLWLILLIILVICTIVRFRKTSRPAGILLLPYLAWLLFAGYLNMAVWLLNR